MNRRRPQKTKNLLHNLKPLTLTINDLSRSGAGVARDENGRAVFVPFTAPGDVVKVKLTKATSKFAEGMVVELIEPSPVRVAPPCPVFGRCGGCQWQHLPYELQWKTKQQGVLDSLRLNKIEAPSKVEAFPADEIWFYRNRIQLRGKPEKIGFFEAKTNELVNITECFIADKKLNQSIAEVMQESEQVLVQSAKSKEKSSSYKVELSLSPNGNVVKTWNAHHGAAGFRQVNDEQNQHLQGWVKNNIKENMAILDLFGGSGNLSLPLMNEAAEIHCVDVNVPESSADLPNHFHFHRSAVVPWLTSFNLNERFEWVALIDPPRDGLGAELAEIFSALDRMKVSHVLLVGCKTDPWSRDIKQLIDRGWVIDQLAIFDFFPQTAHVESAAFLSRGKLAKKKIKKKLMKK